jgi:cell division transport system ATP-binding protein
MIQVSHASKVYVQGDQPALHDVSLSVAKGEFAFLSGPSGAGKTTLLKLIFASERPTSGQILIDGQNITGFGRRQISMLRRRIGVVFQDFKLVETQTVHENVEYPLHVVGMPGKEIRKAVYRVLKGVGLFEKANVLPPRLSGGEQQRVAIARALAGDPTILLADEPTGNLDEETTADIMALFEAASSRRTTILFATHDRFLIENYRKRLIYMRKGELAATGLPTRRIPPRVLGEFSQE